MTYRTKNQNELVIGDWNAICDRCGFKFKASDLRKTWDNLYVCKDDWETRHPSDFQNKVDYSDDPSVAWTRPEIGDSDLTEYVGDAGKTLTKGTNEGIQNWNTELTNDRVVILSSTNAQNGNQFIIYKTVDNDNKLIIISTQRDSGTTV